MCVLYFISISLFYFSRLESDLLKRVCFYLFFTLHPATLSLVHLGKESNSKRVFVLGKSEVGLELDK